MSNRKIIQTVQAPRPTTTLEKRNVRGGIWDWVFGGYYR